MQKRGDFFREERLQLIVEQLMEQKKILVSELSAQFNLSPASIRLDLAELERRGLLRRTYGGAMLPEALDEQIIVRQPILTARQETQKEEKEAIGKAAAALIDDGDTLLLDGGSTMLYFAQQLINKKNLTIVTTALNLIPILSACPGSTIYLSGGQFLPRFEVLGGEIAAETLGRFHIAKCIMGADGISIQHGITATDYAVAIVKRKMIAVSSQLIVLCDHTKVEQVSLLPVAPMGKINHLVLDHRAPPSFVEAARTCGIQVTLAQG